MAKTDNREETKRAVKQTWTSMEDCRLRNIVSHVPSDCQVKWAKIATQIGTYRSGKQCRERWHNHLKPDLKKGKWTEEEDRIIDSLQKKLGNQWRKISDQLPGRTDNDIKNRWHSSMRALQRQTLKDSGENSEAKPKARCKRNARYKGSHKHAIAAGHNTPIKNNEADSMTQLKNAALSLSALKSAHPTFYDTELCNMENHPPLPALNQAPANTSTNIAQSFASAEEAKIQSKGQVKAVEIFSPSYLSFQVNSWNNVTPCSTIALSGLPLCNSGPFFKSTPVTEGNTTILPRHNFNVVMKRESPLIKEEQDDTQWASCEQYPPEDNTATNTHRNINVVMKRESPLIEEEQDSTLWSAYGTFPPEDNTATRPNQVANVVMKREFPLIKEEQDNTLWAALEPYTPQDNTATHPHKEATLMMKCESPLIKEEQDNTLWSALESYPPENTTQPHQDVNIAMERESSIQEIQDSNLWSMYASYSPDADKYAV